MTSAGVPLRMLTADEITAEEAHEAHEEPHGQESETNAGRPDPHIWLNPLLVKTQARTICDALVELDPQHAADYRKNLAAFEADLDRVHAEIAATLAPLKGRELFVFHPAFGYFADAYGLKQVPVEIEGKEPTAKQLAELIARAKADHVKVIFVQPQFSRKSAEAIAQAIGGARRADRRPGAGLSEEPGRHGGEDQSWAGAVTQIAGHTRPPRREWTAGSCRISPSSTSKASRSPTR